MVQGIRSSTSVFKKPLFPAPLSGSSKAASLTVCLTPSVSDPCRDSVVRQQCAVGSMSTPRPKLFILSAGLSGIAVETADQGLCLHPHGFTSSSPAQPSLPSLPPSHYPLPDSFISSRTSTFLLRSFHLSFFSAITQYICLPH